MFYFITRGRKQSRDPRFTCEKVSGVETNIYWWDWSQYIKYFQTYARTAAISVFKYPRSHPGADWLSDSDATDS